MPNYIQDPNNSKKQIPGPLPDNAYDRANTPSRCYPTKTPSYILVNKTLTDRVGFFFASSRTILAV